jgi:CheY-like chemotaxis protein
MHGQLIRRRLARGEPAESLRSINSVISTLVLTDYLMDHEDGLALARRFHRTFPTVPVVILTAFAMAHEGEIAQCDCLNLLHKSVDYTQSFDLIARLSGRPRTA